MVQQKRLLSPPPNWVSAPTFAVGSLHDSDHDGVVRIYLCRPFQSSQNYLGLQYVTRPDFFPYQECNYIYWEKTFFARHSAQICVWQHMHPVLTNMIFFLQNKAGGLQSNMTEAFRILSAKKSLDTLFPRDFPFYLILAKRILWYVWRV